MHSSKEEEVVNHSFLLRNDLPLSFWSSSITSGIAIENLVFAKTGNPLTSNSLAVGPRPEKREIHLMTLDLMVITL